MVSSNGWRVENEGVSPDIDVELDPVLLNRGRDTQLEAGNKEVLEQLKSYKPMQLISLNRGLIAQALSDKLLGALVSLEICKRYKFN